ncbi:MAG: hypothetical protein HYV60_19115 [Planctomycetia bacterium]|nr:hypothetical protein [Planctomycetia bacterium]
MLADGAAGIQAMRGQARALGLTISTDPANKRGGAQRCAAHDLAHDQGPDVRYWCGAGPRGLVDSVSAGCQTPF